MLELRIKGLGPFIEKEVKIANRFVLVLEPTAAGKTTIARVLYAFLTGNVDMGLLSSNKDEGSAELTLLGKSYRLSIDRGGGAKVDKVLSEPYADYLVLTESTPLYTIYASPPKSIDVAELAKRFVPPPPELSQLEAMLKREEPKTVDVDSVIEELNNNINFYRQRIQALEEELEKIDADLSKATELERIKIVLEKRKLEDRAKKLEERVRSISDELVQLVVSLQAENYEELKLRGKDLADKVERLYRRLDMIDRAVRSLEKIKEGLTELRGIVDILAEYGVVLFGQFVSSDTVDVFLNDVEAGIETLTSKRAEVRTEIGRVEDERNKINNMLEDYVRRYQRAEALEAERSRLEKELADLRVRLHHMEKKVRELVQEMGVGEDELLKRVLEAGNTADLLQKKQEIVSEIERLKAAVKDLEKKVADMVSKKEEVQRARKEYEDLKKRYEELKSRWSQQRQLFVKTFRESFKEVFKNITIPDFDPENMSIARAPHTYSQGERFLMAVAYQYALLSALKALGHDIPVVVIDMVVPVDERYEREIIRVYRGFDAIKVLLKTADTFETRAIL